MLERNVRKQTCKTVAATTTGKTATSTSASRHCNTNPAVQATSISAVFCTITEILSPMADLTLLASRDSLAAILAPSPPLLCLCTLHHCCILVSNHKPYTTPHDFICSPLKSCSDKFIQRSTLTVAMEVAEIVTSLLIYFKCDV